MEAFAINIKLLIAQTVNFAILLFLLSKFAYKPIISMMEERKKKIAEGLDQAKEAKELLTNAEMETKKKNDEAFKTAKEIVEKAEKEAADKAVGIIKKANLQADLIVERAKDEAELAKNRAMKEAKSEIAGLISLALDKIIGEELDQNHKEKLTAKAVKEL